MSSVAVYENIKKEYLSENIKIKSSALNMQKLKKFVKT